MNDYGIVLKDLQFKKKSEKQSKFFSIQNWFCVVC